MLRPAKPRNWRRRRPTPPRRQAARGRALGEAVASLKGGDAEKPPNVATRKASELALEAINAALPETIGGSADLTPSNNTLTKGLGDIAPGNFGGRYIRYGIR